MPNTANVDDRGDTVEQQYSELVEAALALPGVAELMETFGKIPPFNVTISDHTVVTFFATGGNATPEPATPEPTRA